MRMAVHDSCWVFSLLTETHAAAPKNLRYLDPFASEYVVHWDHVRLLAI